MPHEASRAMARLGGGVGRKRSWLVPMSIFPDSANAAWPSAVASEREDFAGVHGVVRVEHRLARLHHRNFFRRTAVMQVVALGHADPVLGGNRAVVFLHGLENPGVDRGALGK